MFAPPIAFVVSLVGLVQDESKKYAIAGLTVSGLTLSLWLLPVLCG